MSVIVNSAQGIAGMFSKRRPKATKPEDFLSKDFQKIVDEVLGEARDEYEAVAPLGDRASQIIDAKAKGLKGPW